MSETLSSSPEVTPAPVVPDAAPAPAPDWRSGIPEELRASPALASFKDPGALAKSYVEQSKMVGGSVRIPGETSTPEERASFYAKLGRPEKPEGYALKFPEGFPVAENDPMVTGFRSKAHELGLTPAQAQGVAEFYAGHATGVQKGFREKATETESQLKEEWGAAYPRNLALANRAVEHLGGKEAKEFQTYLDTTGLGNHPVMVRVMARMGQILSEDGTIPGDVVNVPTPANAKDELAKMMNDKAGPYWDAKHPGHAEAVKKAQGLFQLLYPEV